MNIIANISALIAWLFLTYSYYKNKDDRLLIYGTISCIFFMINYLLLGAYTGLLVLVIEFIRNFFYLKKRSIKTFYTLIPFYVIVSIFTYDGIMTFISLIASSLDSYALLYKGKKVVFLSIIVYILWIIYDIYYVSIPNVIAQIILVISNTYILIKQK